jgi:hypothetical protein
MSRSRNLADLLDSSGDVKLANLDNTTSVTVTDNLTSTSTTEALSANQGKTLMDGKPDNSRLLTDVPSSAVFTDTVYSKPSAEPISYVTGLQTALNGKQASGSYEPADSTILKDDDVGTTANKLVQLNGSAELPVVSGANLTNIPDNSIAMAIALG